MAELAPLLHVSGFTLSNVLAHLSLTVDVKRDSVDEPTPARLTGAACTLLHVDRVRLVDVDRLLLMLGVSTPLALRLIREAASPYKTPGIWAESWRGVIEFLDEAPSTPGACQAKIKEAS